MATMESAGAHLRYALEQERPLQIAGAINPYCALLAQRAGFRAIYLSGAGVANASLGVPDLGITNLADVTEDARRITGACDVPLLVDADTGWGSALNIARSVRELIRAGAGALHLEDQAQAKRCGHRPGKVLVAKEEMVDRLKAATDARFDDQFVLMARTDAHAGEGLQAAIERALAYVEAGADAIFPEALQSLEEYRAFTAAVEVPVLANMTEFGRTPLLPVSDLREAGIAMVLYPLSAFRAMSRAAEQVYATIRAEGTQQAVLPQMQTRDELYEILGYLDYERKLDELYGPE